MKCLSHYFLRNFKWALCERKKAKFIVLIGFKIDIDVEFTISEKVTGTVKQERIESLEIEQESKGDLNVYK